jgi:hypothetical protein
MRCLDCKTEIKDGKGYFCEACLAAAKAAGAAKEAESRTVACPSCHQPAGSPCLTGSGVERGSSHVTREALVKKLAKKAAKGGRR